MFIEVYTKEDKDTLLAHGYKLLKEVPLHTVTKYVFVNSNELKFDNAKVKATITNTLTF